MRTGALVVADFSETSVNLTPSNRTSPAAVPAQRKPSRVWMMAVTESDGRLSTPCQTRMAPALSARSKSEPAAPGSPDNKPAQAATNKMKNVRVKVCFSLTHKTGA